MTAPAAQRRHLHVAGRLVQRDLDAGAKLGIAAHQRGQDAVIGGTDERQFQPPGLPVAQAAGNGGQPVHPGQRRAHRPQPLRPERGERHAAPGAREQRRAQFPLQRADGLAERRLRHAQPLRRMAEVQRFRHGDEMPQGPDIHNHISSDPIGDQ